MTRSAAHRTGRMSTTTALSILDAYFAVFQKARVVTWVLRWIREGAIDRESFTFLDAGCHQGAMLHFMEKCRVFPSYIGADIREDYLAQARALKPASRNGSKRVVRWVKADLSTQEVRAQVGGGVDVACCLEVLEHMTRMDAYRSLANLVRVTTTGGFIIVGTPVNTRGKVFHRVEREGVLAHLNFLVEEELLEFMNKAGTTLLHASPCYSVRSSYRVPRALSVEMEHIRHLLGVAFRPFYCSVAKEPTGGGFYIFQKRGKE